MFSSYANLDRVVENIWVGGVNSHQLIVEQGFDAVLDLREGDNPHYREFLRGHGVEYLNVKVSDRHGVSPEVLSRIVEWLDEKVARNEKILVHCNLGRGRSALAIAAYLVCQDLTPEEAMSRIKEKRNVMYMNRHQVQALLDFSKTISRGANHDF